MDKYFWDYKLNDNISEIIQELDLKHLKDADAVEMSPCNI